MPFRHILAMVFAYGVGVFIGGFQQAPPIWALLVLGLGLYAGCRLIYGDPNG